MCKIYVANGINDRNREGHTKLYKAMALVMSEDKSHQDGLGYAAVDEHGKLFGERWLINSEAFTIRELFTDKDKTNIEKYKGTLYKQEKYNVFGELNLDKVAAITLHTRLATSGKEFSNTHPFVENDTSVIHNGVIQNFQDKTFRKGLSTCDSEVILTKYNDVKLNENINHVNKLTKKLKGYYACGIFNRDENGQRRLDILKSSSANLVAGYVKELDSIVFTSLLYQLRKGCELAGLTLESSYDVEPNTLTRLNPFTSEVIESKEFEEIDTYSYYNVKNDLTSTYKAKNRACKTGRSYGNEYLSDDYNEYRKYNGGEY